MSDRIDMLEDYVTSMDGFLVRLAVLLTAHLPATDREVASLLGEWNDIKQQIVKDYAQDRAAADGDSVSSQD